MTAYLMDWIPLNESSRTFMFAHVSEYALPCGNDLAAAEAYCRTLNRAQIEVTLTNGQKHICENFQVETRYSGLAVYCDVPSPIKITP